MKTKGNLHLGLITLAFSIMAIFQAHAATIAWTNLSGGEWNLAANWEPNQVPATGDTAIITNNGTYTVTLNASPTLASLTLGGASGTQTLLIPNSTLSLQTEGSVIGNGVLALIGGALSGTGTLVVSNLMNWTAGTMSGDGRTVIAPGATLIISNTAGLTLNRYRLENGGTVVCAGTEIINCLDGTG
jgi:hypothetical protein